MKAHFDQLKDGIGAISTPRQFHQLGILVLDGSQSMADQAQGGVTKADAVNIGVRDLLTRFKVSRVKENFSFSVINFDNNASLMTPPEEVISIDDNGNYNPMNGKGGGTCIFEGLKLAGQIAHDFLAQSEEGGAPHSVVILLMTDGMCFKPQETEAKANEIKTGSDGGKITICTTYFGVVGNTDTEPKELLKRVATDPVLGFKEVYDAETLRSFFERSISSASGVNLD